MSLSEMLIFLLKRKRYSLGIPFIAGVLGFIIAWILPEYYKSEIRILLDTGTKSSGLTSLLPNAVSSSVFGSIAGLDENAQNGEDMYLEIISIERCCNYD